MQVKLIWQDPHLQQTFQPILETPIALGREFAQMPAMLNGERVSRVVLSDPLIAEFHATIEERENELIIIDVNGTETLTINGILCSQGRLQNGDRLSILSLEIEVLIIEESSAVQRQQPNIESSETCQRLVGFLIPRRCGRTTSENCPYCQGNMMDTDPYFMQPEHSLYPDYGVYDQLAVELQQNYDINRMDFTEADAMAFEETDIDFEQDMDAS